MLPDGCLLHLGREDLQAKIRGHRIEIGEIERLLLEHPGVREAAVVIREERPEEKRLVAYIVAGEEPPPTSGTLRNFLQVQLPTYMVPAAFVQLDSLPLTPSGKVDRRVLAESGDSRVAMETPFAEPRNPVENKLTEIWSSVLGVARVGIHDTFFDLGGHSLHASSIISRVANTFKVEITFRQFFELATVAHLAELISRSMAKEVGDEELAAILTGIESPE